MFATGFDAFKGRALFRLGAREQILPLGDWLHLPGRHNFQNALAASCAALTLGATASDVAHGLGAFRGLPHRLELVLEAQGRRLVNDSKATTPEAAVLALEAIRTPIVLLAGGYDKHVDLTPLVRAAVGRGVKAVGLLGQTAPALKELFQSLDPAGRIAVKPHVTLDGAVRWALGQTLPGDTVLLSPACASYDWFPNYEARGEEFARLARAWAAGGIDTPPRR